MDTTAKTILGFHSWLDLLRSLFKPDKVRLKNLILLAMSFTLILNFVPVLELWVWSPFWTLIVFYAVLVWDFVAAILANNKVRGEKFITQKAKRLPVVIVAYTFLFAMLHLLGKIVAAFQMADMLNPDAFEYLAKGVYFLCFAINFMSAVKHMSLLGLVPKQVAMFLEKFVDIHKNKVVNTVTSDKIISPEDQEDNSK